MTTQHEQEQPEKPLFSEEELRLRPLFNDFYDHLRKTSPDETYGPNALTDTSFDRMMHERNVLSFLIGRVAAKGALDVVLQDAELREGKTVTAEELPHMVVTSLARVRHNGEWDNSGKLREVRRELLTKGLVEHTDYPLISEAIDLSQMLKHDGHEAYAQDAIVSTTKWLERVERRRAQQPDAPVNSGPAA